MHKAKKRGQETTRVKTTMEKTVSCDHLQEPGVKLGAGAVVLRHQETLRTSVVAVWLNSEQRVGSPCYTLFTVCQMISTRFCAHVYPWQQWNRRTPPRNKSWFNLWRGGCIPKQRQHKQEEEEKQEQTESKEQKRLIKKQKWTDPLKWPWHLQTVFFFDLFPLSLLWSSVSKMKS